MIMIILTQKKSKIQVKNLDQHYDEKCEFKSKLFRFKKARIT